MDPAISFCERPDDNVVAAVRGLLVRIERAHEVFLDDSKQAQLDGGGWSAALARDDDDLVGYAHIRWGAIGQRPRAAVEATVDPSAAHAGDLRQRLTEAARDAVAGAGGGWLHVWERDVEDPVDTAAARLGMAVQRRLARMEAPLSDPPPTPSPPPGVRLRAYRPGRDDAALLAVNNLAFAGHPEQGGWTPGDLAARRGRSWFDPDDVLLAWQDGELVGFHWTRRHPGDPPVGEVHVLAVSPAAQGTGLGRTLLLAGLAHLHARGARTALLYVDLADTGPVRLYESAGFTTTRLDVCYEQHLDPA